MSIKGEFTMRVTGTNGENVTIEAPAEDVRAMLHIVETSATRDFDEVIRNTTDEETAAVAQKLKNIFETGNEPMTLNLTKKEIRDISMILAAMDGYYIEDSFPQLLKQSVTDETAERLSAEIWAIREEVSPFPK
ncbi:MAG: hypothetical protein KDJ75_04445 [Alphaproteobacteria bacterium]|nr:hypothetical protein [Alphaproteobacteria bacterium]